MTNETYTLRNGNTLHTVTGLYYDDEGYQDDLAGDRMVIEVDAQGRAWDVEIGCRIRRNAEGNLQSDACCWSFAADEGELERIGARF